MSFILHLSSCNRKATPGIPLSLCEGERVFSSLGKILSKLPYFSLSHNYSNSQLTLTETTMGGARGRKGGGGAERTIRNSSGRKDNPYPPTLSRYPTRSSVGTLLASPSVNPRGSITRNPGQSLILKSALRIIKGVANPELQNCSSRPTGKDPVCENSSEDIKPSLSTGSPSRNEMDLDGLCAKLISQVQGPQPASHQDLAQPPRESYVVPPVEGVQGDSRTTQCLSSHSLNLTEFARGFKDDSDDDPDEVESAPGAYALVNGHKVKIEIAPLLEAIFDKYGDITGETTVKSPKFLSFSLERLCDVYQRLKQTKFRDLMSGEINEMLDELQHMECQKLNVRWLLENVHHISEVNTRLLQYSKVKDEEAKCIKSNGEIDKELELRRRHIVLIQNNMAKKEEEKAANEARAKECKERALEMKASVKTSVEALSKQSLVHGLL